ncbi:hypothetical protein ACN27E_03225 [Mycobacterium sp. WMMD1722]|uniref:hypothetical protein n=1 Tax=Mycobacterium sp. WMMD1722 TaxID=3404117 RepID=UPI003BF56912
MTTDPDEIRTRVAALLGDVPEPGEITDLADSDIDSIAVRLEEAHDVLVQALASVEKG